MKGITRRGVLKAGLAGLTALVLGQQVFAEDDKLREITGALRAFVHAGYEIQDLNRPGREDETAALEATLKKHGFESERKALLSGATSPRLTDFFKQHGYLFGVIPLLGYELQKETSTERIKRKFFGEEHSFTLASMEEPEIMNYDDYQTHKKTGGYANDSRTLSRDRAEFMPSMLEKTAEKWQEAFNQHYELIKQKLEMPVDVSNPNFFAMLFTKANCMALGKDYESGEFAKKLVKKLKECIEIREGMHAFDYFELPENSDKHKEKGINYEVRAMLADIRHGDALLALGRCISYRHNNDGNCHSEASKIILDGITTYAATHRDEFAIDYAEFDGTKNNLHILKQVHKFTPESLQKAAHSIFETRYQGKTLARWLSH